VLLAIIASFLLLTLTNTNGTVTVNDKVRDSRVEDGRCVTEPLDFYGEIPKKDDFNFPGIKKGDFSTITSKGSDYFWEPLNLNCIALGAAALPLNIFLNANRAACSYRSALPMLISPPHISLAIVAADLVFGIAQTSCLMPTATLSVPAASILLIALDIAHKYAIETQKNAHICGEKWDTWHSVSVGDTYVRGGDDKSYQQTLALAINNSDNLNLNLNLKEKKYREYLYAGIEYEDNADGDDSCKMPKGEELKLKSQFGYSGGRQRYYMRGAGLAPNFACERFAKTDKSEEFKTAFDCCEKRSKETICIEETETNKIHRDDYVVNTTNKEYVSHRFCKIGTRCKIRSDFDAPYYSIYEKHDDPNYICAKTYSSCPYNHNLGGGTTVAEYSEKNKTVLTNHCQYLKHCVKKYNAPAINMITMADGGGFISSSCRDLKGDSQNSYVFNLGLVPIKARSFSAPIAQCFKETFENMFNNVAGFTKCKDDREVPDKNGICKNGYDYKKGEIITKESFFQKIQNSLRTAIKMAMTIAVVIMGAGILFSGKIVEKKVLMMFVVKLSLVVYFALGTAWQDKFFEGISGTSMALATIFMVTDTDSSNNDNKKDGCQFPKYNAYYTGDNSSYKYQNPSYFKGQEYLAIWDTLDCKIARAIGFGSEVSVPNAFYIIAASLFTGGFGFVLFTAGLIFVFFLIAITVRALHIFLISSTAIAIMVYVSPITITACLFKKTENIFKSWRTNLIGFVLQPIILFAFLGVFILIFDKVLIGDATFKGDGKNLPKTINCPKTIDNLRGKGNSNSLYCVFNSFRIEIDPALKVIGIFIPKLYESKYKDLWTLINGALLMFIFYGLIDRVGDLAAKLSDSAPLTSQSVSAIDITKSFAGGAAAVEKRMLGATRQVYKAAKKGLKSLSAKKDNPEELGKKLASNVDGGNKSKGNGGKNNTTI
jgi:type IV secretory pathway VirB6-like protein